jgi:hypothetical protein
MLSSDGGSGGAANPRRSENDGNKRIGRGCCGTDVSCAGGRRGSLFLLGKNLLLVGEAAGRGTWLNLNFGWGEKERKQ